MVMVKHSTAGHASIDHNLAHILLPFLHMPRYSSEGGVTSMHEQTDVMYMLHMLVSRGLDDVIIEVSTKQTFKSLSPAALLNLS